MINIYEDRHFDIRRNSWYIGEDKKGHETLSNTMLKFYDSLTEGIKLSEDIRLINS